MVDQTQSQSKPSSRLDRVLKVCFTIALLFLWFLGGILIALFQLPPSGTVKDALTALFALGEQQGMMDQKYPKYIWFPAPRAEKGVTVYRPELAYPGYTLYAPGGGSLAILVDMEGNEVHRWDAEFSRVWPNPEHVSGRVPDRGIHIRQLLLSPNGDLLALYQTPFDTPAGYGVAKLDRDGKVIWTYDARTHHDIDVGPDGTIYTLTEALRDDPIPGWDSLPKNFKDEFLVVATPEGKTVKRLSLYEMLPESPFFRPQIVFQSWDTLHSNTVNVIGTGFASRHEGVSEGDVMVCLRHLNMVIAVNPNTERIVWAINGPWHYPHDPMPLENGNVLIFDNGFTYGPASHSRVLEFDPVTREVVWEYSGAGGEHPLYSDTCGRSQMLPNGNVLINETNGGRLLEVTREGEVAWEFLNPVRSDDGKLIAVVCGAKRYSPDQVPFLDESSANGG